MRAGDRSDPRPLWISVWGGANTLAQALLHVRATRSPAEVEAFVSKLRVYSISDEDDAGPWIRREFPGLFYVVKPSPPNGEEYYTATWTGISGDVYYRNFPGADAAHHHATSGSRRTSARRGRSGSTTRGTCSSWRATRRRSSA